MLAEVEKKGRPPVNVWEFEGEPMALFVYEGRNNQVQMVLYQPGPGPWDPITFVAMIKAEEISRTTQKPCIPETWHITNAGVNEQFQGRGIGKLMFGLLFDWAARRGIGLTSDHQHSSSPTTAKYFKDYEFNPKYQKRQTGMGHDEFDYEEKTMDPDDDCKHGEERAASNHSFTLTSNEFHPEFVKLTNKHEEYASDKNLKRYHRKLFMGGGMLFDKVYKK